MDTPGSSATKQYFGKQASPFTRTGTVLFRANRNRPCLRCFEQGNIYRSCNYCILWAANPVTFNMTGCSQNGNKVEYLRLDSSRIVSCFG